MLCSYVPAQLVCSEVPGVAVMACISVQHHARASMTLVLDEHEHDAMGASSQAWGGTGEGFWMRNLIKNNYLQDIDYKNPHFWDCSSPRLRLRGPSCALSSRRGAHGSAITGSSESLDSRCVCRKKIEKITRGTNQHVLRFFFLSYFPCNTYYIEVS